MRYKRLKRLWRKFKYWFYQKAFSEEERKVLFNIRMGFYEEEKYDGAGSD